MIGLIRNSQMVKDYSEFSGESINSLVDSLLNHKEINKNEFNGFDNSFEFYDKSNSYVYDLLFNNLHKQRLIDKLNLFSPQLFKNLFKKEYKTFCEFGGGVGLMCELVKDIRPNMEVTYVDIKSKISDFAIWRYQKYKKDIKTMIIPQDDFTLPNMYDVIFTDAVIEHLEEEQQNRYMNKLSSYINKGGILIALIDLEGKNEIMPMHNNVNIVNLHNIVEQSGMICLYGRNTFSSIWKKL